MCSVFRQCPNVICNGEMRFEKIAWYFVFVSVFSDISHVVLFTFCKYRHKFFFEIIFEKFSIFFGCFFYGIGEWERERVDQPSFFLVLLRDFSLINRFFFVCTFSFVTGLFRLIRSFTSPLRSIMSMVNLISDTCIQLFLLMLFRVGLEFEGFRLNFSLAQVKWLPIFVFPLVLPVVFCSSRFACIRDLHGQMYGISISSIVQTNMVKKSLSLLSLPVSNPFSSAIESLKCSDRFFTKWIFRLMILFGPPKNDTEFLSKNCGEGLRQMDLFTKVFSFSSGL